MSFTAKKRTFGFTAKVRQFSFTAKQRTFAFTAKVRAIAEGYIAMLLKTGQITQYGGYEDDGYHQKGIARSYTVLTAGQYAGTTAIVLNAKTDNHSNNCVQDNVTGLMWSRYVSASVGPANDGLLPWTTAGGEGIFPYIDAANAAYLAGYNDWRVPNKRELESLMNLEAPSAVPDAVAFPGWPAQAVWTSTSTPTAPAAGALYSLFSAGYTLNAAKTTNYYCALVRG